MKLHPELTIEEIIKSIMSPEAVESIKAVGREETPEERAKAQEQFIAFRGEMASKILVCCAGCSDEVLLTSSFPCICGQFICSACKESEEDGVCEHEPPDIPGVLD